MDVDCIIGHKKVLELRKILEDTTGMKCIPVWHISRGLEEWYKLSEEYDYIAIGGIVTKEFKTGSEVLFKKLVRIAHKNNCKVHGLGYTSIKNLRVINFDSVDSTSWKSGGRFGQCYIFSNGELKMTKPKGKRANYKLLDQHNLNEWIKLQKYFDCY